MTTGSQKVPTLPAPYTAADAQTRILKVAAAQVNYREGRSGGDWNNDTAYGKWFGMNFNPWCAMFVSWAASVAGFTKIIPRHAYTPDGFNWFKARGQNDGRVPPNKVGREATGLGKPRRGDIMFVYSASLGRISHVGFVENATGGYVTTIEGNTDPGGSAQGNGVYRLKRKITARLYFCHPAYASVVIPRTSGGGHAKPPAAVTPPKKEEDSDMATLKEMQTAFENALETKLVDRFRKADDAHDSQEFASRVAAQSYSDIRMAELLADGDGTPEAAKAAMTTVKEEVWPFLSALWPPKP